MTVFYEYKNEKEITGLTFDNTWYTVDLGPSGFDFIENLGETVAVEMRAIRDNPPGTKLVGLRGVNDTTGWYSKVGAVQYFQTLIELAGGTSIQYSAGIGDTVRLFVTGEMRGPVAKAHPTAIYHNLDEGDGWETWTPMRVTPIGGDTFGDIEYIVVKTVVFDVSATFGIREIGSVEPVFGMEWASGQSWWVVRTDDDGYIEVLSSGKSGNDNEHMRFYEVGYIRYGSDLDVFTDPQIDGDTAVAQTVGWESFDMRPLAGSPGSSLPDDTVNVGGMWMPGNLNGRAFFRQTGAGAIVRPALPANRVHSQMVQLDANGLCEVNLQRSSGWFVVHWWETPSRAQCDTDTFMGPLARTDTFAGPACDTTAALGSAVASSAHAGPASLAAAALTPYSDTACFFGPQVLGVAAMGAMADSASAMAGSSEAAQSLSASAKAVGFIGPASEAAAAILPSADARASLGVN